MKEILFALVIGGGLYFLATVGLGMLLRLISGDQLIDRPKKEEPVKHPSISYDTLGLRLLNRNDSLDNIPHRKLFKDMALCLTAKTEDRTQLITTDTYKNNMWYSAENTAPELEPPVLESYTESRRGHARNVLFDSFLTADDNMFVLTNKSHNYGASVLFYGGILKQLYQLFGEYYALPTSVHKWMIIPVLDGDESERKFLKNKVIEDNKKLSAKDILSNSLYYFGGRELEVIL